MCFCWKLPNQKEYKDKKITLNILCGLNIALKASITFLFFGYLIWAVDEHGLEMQNIIYLHVI